MIGPVVLQVRGDQYTDSCRISSIVWEGATTEGDRIELTDPLTHELLHAIRTPDTHTYIGVTFGTKGLSAPNGFLLRTSPSAAQTIQVYLMEL